MENNQADKNNQLVDSFDSHQKFSLGVITDHGVITCECEEVDRHKIAA